MRTFILTLGLSLFGFGSANAQAYACSFNWGVNLDLGYCGWVPADKIGSEELSVEIDAVARPDRDLDSDLPELGEPDVCNAFSSLSELKSGMTIKVPATCLSNQFTLMKWGGRLDKGYSARVVPGSFNGQYIGLDVTEVDAPRFGGRANECSGEMEIKNLVGQQIRVPVKCVGKSVTDEVLRRAPEIWLNSN